MYNYNEDVCTKTLELDGVCMRASGHVHVSACACVCMCVCVSVYVNSVVGEHS